ncbi:N-acetylmuramoyl-L-alanine amidase [Parasediminibacterium sp. JCM 36343]|uniref:N-acetylmuramoyl-L-alanine amidase n=1 Tax=Parasediminibacterium sp. JCM 36343 TaxID=3374279 RepID=UPI003978FA98
MQKILMAFILGLLCSFCARSQAKIKYLSTPTLSKAADTNSIHIIEKPLAYPKEREALSLQYLKERHCIIQDRPTIKPVIIVLHFTDGGTVNSIFNYFNSSTIENGRPFNKKESRLNVSSQYLIDRDGTIYHLMPDTLFARHIIGLNYCAIGIENIGSKEEPLTNEQVKANEGLVRLLCSKYKITYLIGHSEYVAFRYSSLWKETNPSYLTEKEDPGKDFLIKVRNLLSDLKLKSKP